jgi:hypothetical protein
MKLIFRASFFLFIFFLLSCKKDKKDVIAPTITCTAPAVGDHHNMFDTITVSATVTDDQHLAYINVTLTDYNHTPLQASYSVPIKSAGFTFTIKYILTQFHLQTGNYLIQITADDGYNTGSLYQPITITESPTQLWGYCTALKNTPHIINQISAAGSSISSITLAQAYNGMKYGGYNQQLYVNGKGTMPFQAIYLQPGAANQLAYSASATINQQDYTCIYTDGYKPYIGFLNSDINSFDNTGAYSTSYRLNDPNFYPYLFTKTSSYGVGVFKSKNVAAYGPDKIVSFSGFGAFFNSSTLPAAKIKVVALFEKGDDSLYVLGNDSNNQAQVYIYYAPDNNFSNALINGSLGSMLSAVKVSSNYAIFSTASGYYSVNEISVNQNSLFSTGGAQKLTYQPKLNMLTAAVGFNLNSYYVSTYSLTPIATNPSINCSDSIIDFDVITNK